MNEISQSAQVILDAYAAEGKYITLRAPHGYRKSHDDCHKLLVGCRAKGAVAKTIGISLPALRRISAVLIIVLKKYIRESDIIAAIRREFPAQQSEFIASEVECKRQIMHIKGEIHKLEEVQKVQLQKRKMHMNVI